MTIELTKKNLLLSLKQLRKNGPSDQAVGIYWNVRNIMADGILDKLEWEIEEGLEDFTEEIFNELFPEWPNFSGILHYPVGNGEEDYNKHMKLFDRRTEYGRLRYELLDFLISELEKEVKS